MSAQVNHFTDMDFLFTIFTTRHTMMITVNRTITVMDALPAIMNAVNVWESSLPAGQTIQNILLVRIQSQEEEEIWLFYIYTKELDNFPH